MKIGLNLILKWVARVFSVASVFFIFLFIISHLAYSYEFNFKYFIFYIFLPLSVVSGLLIGLKNELLGSIISIFALFTFYLLYYFVEKSIPEGLAFLILTSPALLYLISWIIDARKIKK